MDTTKVLKSFDCEILMYMVGYMERQIVSLGLAHTHFYNMPDNLKYGTSQCLLRRPATDNEAVDVRKQQVSKNLRH